MELTLKNTNGINVLGIIGKLDTNTWSQLEEKIIPLIDGGENNFVLDCTQLDYISSAGLRVLLMAAKKLKSKNGKIVIASLKSHIKEVFDIAGFSTIFVVTASVEEGLSSF